MFELCGGPGGYDGGVGGMPAHGAVAEAGVPGSLFLDWQELSYLVFNFLTSGSFNSFHH